MSQYAITRLKAARNAWYWAVHFRRRGKMHSRRFYDQKHGSSKKALAAAVAWRDRNIARSAVLTMREFRQQKRTNNTSGVPGVHFLTPATQPAGVWQARVALPDGRKVHRTFSVRRHGKRGAFDKAVAARAELLRLVEDRPYLKNATALRLRQHQKKKTRAVDSGGDKPTEDLTCLAAPSGAE